MAGILDSKQRILDTIITKEGRRQIASGELQIKYVTFTDSHTFYSESPAGDGSVEPADDRIFLESFHRPQDQIVFETDNDARLLPFAGSDIKIGYGGKIYKDVVSSVNTNEEQIAFSIDETLDAAETLLYAAENNFKDQKILGTLDKITGHSGFLVEPNYIQFKITDTMPFGKSDITEASITSVESLHEDKRLQHLPFYQYLPPVNLPKPGQEVGEPLGRYKRLSQPEVLTLDDLEKELDGKEVSVIDFSETSLPNNIAIQFLEFSPGEMQKLSMIDFGEFPSEDPFSPGKRVFFVGKIYDDDEGMSTFVNIFTVIME